ncbi:sugar phosphate isomerase/epimerase [Larkinella arboricola]|uniref:Sugar phosphate isomerase/epimerase n=1 Tax=Larkinella arboricola TaxID=643671 RepID=A0A327WRG7_LARAB|nr:sugar phosphate isomerase/epimerase family protein [Larkinella arboricola]RAJ94536.1 sugar phosphate isomerase/epimerase [Larkinella arboricola]
MNRRQTLAALAATTGGAVLSPSAHSAASFVKDPPPFAYALNVSTIRGQNLGFVKELEVASKAGFRHVEIWMNSFQDYLKTHTTADVRKLLGDLGLQVENAIGFAQWIVDDETTRTKGVDQLKQEMELLAEIGCKRTAAPPMGATQQPGLDLRKAAERYRTILELGDKTGVVPQLELWGGSKNMNKLSEVMFVAIESGHPSARLLLDIYHLYKGGSSPASLPLVGKPGIEVFHLNDYPTNPPRETIGDADRVYPGDGIGPVRETLRQIKTPGKTIVLSLELFNKSYYAQDALAVAKTGLAKMKKVAEGA